ncbi:MAG: sigma-70 family RNA polymerase sigma factor [Bryobacteraceae bacterium]
MSSVPKPDTAKLIDSFRPYAHALASEVLRKLPSSIEKDDLIGAAELGLVEAASAFDPSRGVLFKTFAYYRIRGAVYDALRKMGWFSKTLYDQYKFEMAANEYMKDYASAPPPAGDSGQDLQDLQNLTGTIVSCYLLSIDDMTHELTDTAARDPETQYAETEERQRLREAIAQLPEKNRQVLEGYYFQNLSLEEVGSRLGLSKSWVCRVHAKSLDMVRSLLTTPVVAH